MRAYSAVDGTRFGSDTLTLQGSTFFESSGTTFNVLVGRMSDSFADLHFDHPSVAEMITQNSYFDIYGGAEGPIGSGSRSELRLWARLEFCEAPKVGSTYPDCSVTPITCTSTEHTLTLERSGGAKGGT